MSSLTSGLMAGLAMRQNNDQRQQYADEQAGLGKTADAFFKTNMGKAALAEMGLLPDEVANLGAQQKFGLMKGYHEASTLNNFMSEMKAREMALQRQQTQQQQQAALERALGSLGGNPVDVLNQGNGPVRSTPTPETMLDAMARNPAAAGTQGGHVILNRALAALNADRNASRGVTEGVTSFGLPYAYRNGQVHFMDALVPGNPKYNKPPKEQREPGDGPQLSKDGKFYWDAATGTWKPIPGTASGAAKKSSTGDMFNGAGGDAAAAADPLGLGL